MRWYLVNYHLLSSTCCKMEAAKSVVFDMTSYPPLILAFCSSVHRYYPFHWYQCICSVDLGGRRIIKKTHGFFATPFPPSFFLLVVAPRWWSPGARWHLWRLLLPRGCLLPCDGRRRLGVVRRLPGRRPCLFDWCCFCASLLRQICLTYVCTHILLLPLTLVYSSLCIRALEAPGL